MMNTTSNSKAPLLWVDDDLFYYKSFEEELGEQFDIEIVRNADEFWKTIVGRPKDHFAGIIMDIILPFGKMVRPDQAEGGLNTGIALVEMIKTTEFKNIPIVIFTIRDASDVDEVGIKYDIPVFRKSQVRMEEFIDTIVGRFKP